MFANECLGELQYEATASSIAMTGVFLSFLIEYIGSRLAMRRTLRSISAVDNEQQVSSPSKEPSNESPDRSLAGLGHSHAGLIHPDNHFSVAVMESGIVFHSIREFLPSSKNCVSDSHSDWHHAQCHPGFISHHLIRRNTFPPNVRGLSSWDKICFSAR